MNPQEALAKLKAILKDPKVQLSETQARDMELAIVIFEDCLFKLQEAKK